MAVTGLGEAEAVDGMARRRRSAAWQGGSESASCGHTDGQARTTAASAGCHGGGRQLHRPNVKLFLIQSSRC
jgi:hypothetical protein